MTSYDAIADWYDQLIENSPIYREVILPSLLDLVGDVDGQVICDLGCGQGWIARELADRDAQVTGIDSSVELLDRAQLYEQDNPLGITYLVDDAQTLTHLPDTSFSGVVCSMVLMNIPDLRATVRAIRRILKPSGWIVAAVTHPCFQTLQFSWVTKENGQVVCEVAAYFDERYWTSDNADGVRGKVGSYHRMLSTYLNTFAEADFIFERMDEPQADGQRAEQVPGNREVPSILSMRLRAPCGSH